MEEGTPVTETDRTDAPFPAAPSDSDLWIRRATWVVAAAIVVVGAYFGWTYFSDRKVESTQSPAARAVSNLRNIVAKDPNNAIARVNLAEAMIVNDQQSEAIT